MRGSFGTFPVKSTKEPKAGVSQKQDNKAKNNKSTKEPKAKVFAKTRCEAENKKEERKKRSFRKNMVMKEENEKVNLKDR